MNICDTHAHVFPAKIAQKAADSIGEFYGYEMVGNGTTEQMLQMHEEAGITRAIINSVAITPKNVEAINTFIAGEVEKYPEHCVGFAAVHPDCADLPALMHEVRSLGLKGFKIHPDMQKFALDSPASMDMFDIIRKSGMPILIHTGDKRYEYSNPAKMKKVCENFPDLVCICAHLGGHSEWDDAVELLTKFENVYTDTSSSLAFMSPERARDIIRSFDIDRVMFGTDYPMWRGDEELERLKAVGLSDAEMEKILWDNSDRFCL